MAITVFHTIRLARPAGVAPFLAAAASEAKKRKWKVRPIAASLAGSDEVVGPVLKMGAFHHDIAGVYGDGSRFGEAR